MTDKKNLARRLFLHTAADAAQSYVQWAEKLKEEPGISYGCILDKFIIPLHPGDLMAVVSRPGHGKSSFMAYMARKTAEDIVKRGADDEVVIYASWEQPIEEIEAFFESGAEYTSTDMAWGRVSMDVIRRQSVKRARLPIWYIGTSLRHANQKKPRMYVEYVYEAIESMYREFGKKPALICLDYIQRIPVKRGSRRTETVAEATFQAKELLMNVGAPGIAGVQAGRQVDDYADPIPSMADAQWSSAIEQTADKQISVWRPIKTHDPEDKTHIQVGGNEFKNTEELFVIKLLKQRFERGFGAWAVHFKPQTLDLHDYDLRGATMTPGRNGQPKELSL